MARGRKLRTRFIDKSGLVPDLVAALAEKGSVRLEHFGLFRVVLIKGQKRYDFAARKIVPQKPFKKITFTPSKIIRDMLKEGKMTASSG